MARNAFLVAALTTLLAACSLLPGASLSPRELALRQLAAQQATWQSKGLDDYVITIERQCFCPGGQFEITVVDGIVTGVTNDTLPVRPDEVQGLPKTVPELFAVVSGLPAEAAVTVSYDETFGFPALIEVDPIPNAIDDEYTLVVHGFRPAS